MLLALAVSGCSYQLASLVSSDDSEPQSTGTIKQPPAASSGAPSKASSQTELDLAYARSAASEALSRGGKGGSVPWENPHSGAGGNITPLATSYSDAGIACRDFLASYILPHRQRHVGGKTAKAAEIELIDHRLSGLVSVTLRGACLIPTLK